MASASISRIQGNSPDVASGLSLGSAVQQMSAPALESKKRIARVSSALVIQILSTLEANRPSQPRDEDRLNAVRQLPAVALTLGPQRTRTELLPYVKEQLMDTAMPQKSEEPSTWSEYSMTPVEASDELAELLAKTIGEMLEFLGGNEYLDAVLPLLIPLASSPEIGVRDQALAALGRVIELTADPELMDKLLKEGDSDNPRRLVALSYLLTPMLKKVSVRTSDDFRPSLHLEIVELFNELLCVPRTVVRRAAAACLNSFVVPLLESNDPLTPSVSTTSLDLRADSGKLGSDEGRPEKKRADVPLAACTSMELVFMWLDNVAKDQQDAVRLLAVSAGLTVFSTLLRRPGSGTPEMMMRIWDFFNPLARADGWFTRFTFAQSLPEITELLIRAPTHHKARTPRIESIMEVHLDLMKDSSNEVRQIAFLTMAATLKNYAARLMVSEDADRSCIPLIITEVQETINEVCGDPETQMRLLCVRQCPLLLDALIILLYKPPSVPIPRLSRKVTRDALTMTSLEKHQDLVQFFVTVLYKLMRDIDNAVRTECIAVFAKEQTIPTVTPHTMRPASARRDDTGSGLGEYEDNDHEGVLIHELLPYLADRLTTLIEEVAFVQDVCWRAKCRSLYLIPSLLRMLAEKDADLLKFKSIDLRNNEDSDGARLMGRSLAMSAVISIIDSVYSVRRAAATSTVKLIQLLLESGNTAAAWAIFSAVGKILQGDSTGVSIHALGGMTIRGGDLDELHGSSQSAQANFLSESQQQPEVPNVYQHRVSALSFLSEMMVDVMPVIATLTTDAARLGQEYVELGMSLIEDYASLDSVPNVRLNSLLTIGSWLEHGTGILRPSHKRRLRTVVVKLTEDSDIDVRMTAKSLLNDIKNST